MRGGFDGSAEQHFWPRRLGFARVNLLWTDRMGQGEVFASSRPTIPARLAAELELRRARRSRILIEEIQNELRDALRLIEHQKM